MTYEMYENLKGSEIPLQGLANCARRCLEVKRDFPRQIPIWVYRRQVEAVTKALESELKFLVHAIEDYIELPVDHAEKPHDLLARFAEGQAKNGAFAVFRVTHEDRLWARICDESELKQVLEFLQQEQLIAGNAGHSLAGISNEAVYNMQLQMTVKGWESVRRKRGSVLSNQVFIATQFKWPDAEEPERLKTLEAIKSACSACGFSAEIVSQNHTGFITDKVISEIKKARFVVAELTYNNRGVYFEAGLARGLGIDVFHVIRADHISGDDNTGKRVHFDIQQIRYLKWTEPLKLQEELRDWILATIGQFQL